jgi:hypothetical protein
MSYQSLILGAGNSSNAGVSEFQKCKFLVDGEKTLLDFSISNQGSASRIVVALDSKDYNFFKSESFSESVTLVPISRSTQGALATAGMCLDALSDHSPIIVSAIDGICPNYVSDFYRSMLNGNSDGGAVVFTSDHPNYCYVRISSGSPIEFAEKRKIGTLASAGIYYFKNKRLLEEAILWAILNQAKFDGRYYFSSALNKLIFDDKIISLFKINENEYLRFSTELEAIASKQIIMGCANE